MGKKNIIPKRKAGTAGSSRKKRAEAVENVLKMKKIEELVSELDSELKKISDYVDSSEDVAKRSVNGDSEESNSDDGDNDSLSVPYLSRWHTTKSDKIIKGDPLKYKGKVTENVHPYIIPTVCETKMDYMIMFEQYTDEVKNNILDGLKKVTSKDAAGTSSPGDLHKRVAVLMEAVLDIAVYIREKRMKKKEKDERQHKRADKEEVEKEVAGERNEEAEEETSAAGEEREEGVEEKETEEVPVATDADKEGEEGENEEAAAAMEKKIAEDNQKDVVMDIVDEMNSNTYVDEEFREKDI
ncbi:glutamic acid-rich protein-like [Capsicum annuum]|uniref:glutamic acid-rich protein-like n=1 Tax=Capsicum annuum TaxID=4072 RepID=UPI001FB0EC20|nr:glutamic acid-rich protein-like [Capsicum annuum]